MLGAVGCGRTDSGGEQRDAADAGAGEALAATPGFARQTTPYTARTLDSFGRALGWIEIDGAPPADSIFRPSVDQAVCGTAFTRRGVDRRGNRAVGIPIWLDGIRSGKPLPLERRFEITNDRCALVPELQTAIAGGTLNVRNLDEVEHRTRIVRQESGDALATIRETDEGQVVPVERVLAKPGLLALSCEVHPWTHAWIAVFDHPYFTTSGSDGSFAIDSIPPGRYRVHAWHPRLGIVEDSLTVEAGRDARIVLHAKASQ